MGRNGKSVNKHFRFSEAEAMELKKKSADCNMTETEYLRFLISQRPRDYPEIKVLLHSLINEVNKIGVNINQIVKNHNSALYSVEDKYRLSAYMKKLNAITKEVAMKLGDQ